MTGAGLSIAILGGGSAGWIAACLLADAWPAAVVTLVESPEIGIIGVGEGSTPQLRHMMRRLGITDADWMPACHATYKTGIAFRGWSARPGYTGYIHPFASDLDLHTEPAFHAAALARRRGAAVAAHPDAFFLNSWLTQHGRAPLAPGHFPFDAHYGYHFDAHLLGRTLRDHAVGRGVRHVEGRVERVEVDAAGQVAKLLLAGDDTISADLFVDASGFRSAIAGEALGVRFRPFGENLFNDRAVVMPTPAAPATPATTATALSAGWAWGIPLTSRTGNGYVYASAYIDADAAEAELRRHLGIGEDADVAARHLSMKVGRLETTWTGNCLAVGLAQGFLEPLEATALHLVIATVEGFVDAYAAGGFSARQRDAFNAAIARRYEGIRDYLVAHYRLNQRSDTAYWRDNAGHDRLSDSLKGLMTAWFTGRDLAEEVAAQDIGHYYAPLSWGCLFAGYGTFPVDEYLRPAPPPHALSPDFLARCGGNYPDHLAVLGQRGTKP